MSDLIIRAVDGKTDERLVSLWLAAFSSDPFDYVESFLSHLPEDAITLIGECDGKPVTMLFLLASAARFRGINYPVRYLYAGCTHPDYRGRGYYRELMSAAADKVAELNENAIYLHPADDILTATYLRLGYKTGICSSKPQDGVVSQSLCPFVDTYLRYRVGVIDELSTQTVFWNTNELTTRFFVTDAVSRQAKMYVDDSGVALTHGKAILESLDSQNVKGEDKFCLWLPINDTPLIQLMDEYGGLTGLVGE